MSAPTPIQAIPIFGQQRGATKPTNSLFAPLNLDFTSTTAYLIDASNLQGNVAQFPILGIHVDNTQNPNELLFQTGAPVSETFSLPAGACGRLPIESGTPVKILVTSGAAFAGKVQVILLNYAPNPIVWFPLGPQTSFATRPAVAIPLGYQQIIGLAAATGLTVPPGAICAVVSVETQPVRYRDDGTNPTAAVGMPILPGQTVTFNENLAALEFIQQAATATLNISYYKFV